MMSAYSIPRRTAVAGKHPSGGPLPNQPPQPESHAWHWPVLNQDNLARQDLSLVEGERLLPEAPDGDPAPLQMQG